MPQYDLLTRSSEFCDRCIQVALSLQGNGVCWEISRQITRSSGSVGANIEEAIGGQSRSDFIHKLSIAYKEARETNYWIKLLKDTKIISDEESRSLLSDCNEIIKILGAIQKTTKSNL